MVLAELSGDVAKRSQQFGNGRIFLLDTFLGAGQSDFQESRAQRALAGDECRASGGAALLRVVAGEQHPFVSNPVDVGRAIAHHPHVVGAQVEPADVIPEDHQDVRLLLCVAESHTQKRETGQHRNSKMGALCLHIQDLISAWAR
jgi:hypothetical protein